MTTTRAQALAVAYDAAEEDGVYDDALRERVAASLHRLRITSAWHGACRYAAGSARAVGHVLNVGNAGWDRWAAEYVKNDRWVDSVARFDTQADACTWVDEQLRADGWVLAP